MSETRQRTEIVAVRRPPEEHQRIVAKARELGISVSRCLRESALAETSPGSGWSVVNGRVVQRRRTKGWRMPSNKGGSGFAEARAIAATLREVAAELGGDLILERAPAYPDGDRPRGRRSEFADDIGLSLEEALAYRRYAITDAWTSSTDSAVRQRLRRLGAIVVDQTIRR